MSTNVLKKIFLIVFLCYWILAGCFYWIAGDQIQVRSYATDMLQPMQNTGELLPGMQISQRLVAQADMVLGVSLYLSTFERTNSCTLVVQLKNDQGVLLEEKRIPASGLRDNTINYIAFNNPVYGVRGETLELTLFSPDSTQGNAVCLWYGNTFDAGKVRVDYLIPPGQQIHINGVEADGMLIYRIHGQDRLWFGQYYWHMVVIVAILLAGYFLYIYRAAIQERPVAVMRFLHAFQRYGYLLRQLIARDFKAKYKRSVLGVFWSFLNPLLTMLVQYIIFSTLFKSGIPNFALYLLTGIVCFNFFNESATMSLQSIVGNATLITKVYVPKYIYPLSRVLSSTINLMLSMIPLLVVMLVTHTPLTPAIFLLPYGILCLMCVSVGMSFFLSAAMVFFRDTQFLWGVISMLWMYATPIFYPESILPTQLLPLFKCNPLYHIIRFIRIVLMDGVSPEPKAYLLCLIASIVPLLLGAVVFKRNQDNFILNL